MAATGDRPGAAARREAAEQRPYDPRREARRQLLRLTVPDEVDPRDLDTEVRQELRSLAKDTADLAAKHLVMTGRLLDDDPETALAHARAAGALAGRIGPVREAVGLAAYAAEEWAEALSELRTARRITGRAEHLAVQADCERALGRPERALAVLEDLDVPKLEQSARVELVIVVAGARRDLGQPDAAVLLLQGPARATTARRPWATRLWYAYADALLAADRADEAREWFAKSAEQDGQGGTDALDRLLELDGVVLEDLQGDDGDDDEPEPEQVDLEALLVAPVTTPQEQRKAGPEQEELSGQEHRDPAGPEPAAAGGAATAPAPGADDLPPPPSLSAQPDPAADGSSTVVVSTEDAGGRRPVVGVTSLFSDEEPVAVAEPPRLQVPVVRFAPPPADESVPADEQ